MDKNQKALIEEQNALSARMDTFAQQGLRLNMTRGVPSHEQLMLSRGMMSCLDPDDYLAGNGIDCRNYGGLDGIPEMKRIFADILDVDPAEVIVGGNSSLSLMFDNIASNMTHGVRDGTPWQEQGVVKFICPTPGYDRHFAICKYFHIAMIPVPISSDSTDIETIERLVASDPMIKGLWCVPIFSNPTGIVYSDETVRRFARLRPAADDFRLYWDNAYVIHHFRGERRHVPNIIRECEEAGNPNMPLVFSSFSKVSFSGAAVACIASSKSNCDFIRRRLTVQTIGPDKLNQLRHVRFFGSAEGVYKHMQKQADIIRPKFELVDSILTRELSDLPEVSWTRPDGGYFVSFQAPAGTAKRIVGLCKQAGVEITPAGATFPYGNDPDDSNIRIAPTAPPIDDLRDALLIFCTAVKLAAVENSLKSFEK